MTVALGGAPLALGGLGALAAARGALTKTAARREKIQAEIAAREAEKKAVVTEVDGEGLFQATGLLGAAAASLAAIVISPLGGTSDFELPSLPSLPAVSVQAPKARSVEVKAPSEADITRAKLRALQASRLEEKRAANEARLAAAKAKATAARAQKAADKAAEVDQYASLFGKATASGPEAATVSAPSKIKKESKVQAAPSSDIPADALKDVLAKTPEPRAPATPAPAVVDDKAVAAEKAAAEKKAQEAALMAKQEAESKAKAEAAAAAQAKKEAEAQLLAQKKAAAAEQEAKAAAEKKAALAKAEAEKKAEATKVVAAAAPAPVPAPVVSKDIPADMQVSAETMALLKSLKK